LKQNHAKQPTFNAKSSKLFYSQIVFKFLTFLIYYSTFYSQIIMEYSDFVDKKQPKSVCYYRKHLQLFVILPPNYKCIYFYIESKI